MAKRGELFHKIQPAGDIFCISISIEFYLAPRLSLPLHASCLFPLLLPISARLSLSPSGILAWNL